MTIQDATHSGLPNVVEKFTYRAKSPKPKISKNQSPYITLVRVGWTIRGTNLGMAKRLFLNQNAQTGYEAHTDSYPVRTFFFWG
jgi:hypothetical protein